MRIPPGLLVSFQRFQWPDGGTIERAPASLGALPIGFSVRSGLLLPVATFECFWIGLEVGVAGSSIAFSMAIELRDGRILETSSGRDWSARSGSWDVVRDAACIDGIRRPDGRFDAFARSAARSRDALRLLFRVGEASGADGLDRGDRATASVRLVDYEHFSDECGFSPSPLDPSAGYNGWRLP